MLKQIRLFQNLNNQEKIEFFVKCQELLLSYHPKSEYVTRQNNLQTRLDHTKFLIQNYKGYCYMDENICILFNKIFITDPKDKIGTMRIHQLRPPAEPYNAASIDFVVFRKIKDALEFCKFNYDLRIMHIIYIKDKKISIYKTEKFISKLFHIPIA